MTAGRYTYHCFGLNIASELECPELFSDTLTEEANVTIRFGQVPEKLSNYKAFGVRYFAKPGKLLLTIDDVAKYLIINGNEIIVDPAPKANEDSIRLFLLGSALGALLQQRGMLVLHGSVVDIGDRCVTFVGHSGMGKSTLATAFSQRGYKLLSDDLCAIKFDNNNQTAMVYPGYPQTKLWQDALEQLNHDPETLSRIRPEISKRKLPIHQVFSRQPKPLSHLFQLGSTDEKTVQCSHLSGADIIECLKTHSYRQQYILGHGLEVAHFKQCIALAQQITSYDLKRPNNKQFYLNDMITYVEAETSS
ncbi:hypothetical protein [Photobacterium kasasachensis]|uniref:hypothetical protein n=1 Tax=Photobacterium kasasachensis TaxID=2910240 RepID=UPI003D0AC6D0